MKADGKKTKRFITDLFFLVIACCVGAFATTAVMLPNGLTSGGLTGIVRILQTFIPMDFSVMYYALAILIWVVVVALLGMEEGRKVLVVTLLYPAILVVFEQINFQLLEEKDVILAAIFCGVFAGVCNGLVFWRGYSFCGTESVAKILKKKLLPHVDISIRCRILPGGPGIQRTRRLLTGTLLALPFRRYRLLFPPAIPQIRIQKRQFLLRGLPEHRFRQIVQRL